MAPRSAVGGGSTKVKRETSSRFGKSPKASCREETSLTIPPAPSRAASQSKESRGLSNDCKVRSTEGTHQPDTLACVMCPLFYSLLSQKALKPKGIYTVEDAREIFGPGSGRRVSRRTIQERISTGKLRSRNLPGRGRFLAEDFEHFLENSVTEPLGKERK
jgi:hypothetical protein